MSMTQIAFLNKADLPTKSQIEKSVCELGYEFKIYDNFENFYGIDGIECSINGHKTFFEIYFNHPSEVVNTSDSITTEITDQDTAVSFIWGADYAAGASIGLISITLIEISKALIYYMDDDIKYSKEMLLKDTPKFLKELEKEIKQPELNTTSKLNDNKNLWKQIKSYWKK